VAIGGTTSNPTFMPDVKGMVNGKLKGLGSLGDFFGKKKPN